MKRKILFLLLLVTLLGSACSKKPPEETLPPETVPETVIPTETQPELEYVTAQTNGIPAVLATFSRGDVLDVVQAYDEWHYIVKLEKGYGLVERNLVRMEDEAEYAPWTGYASHNAEIYDNYRLAGMPVKKLTANAKVEVLDDLGWCVLVRHEGEPGYMKPGALSKSSGNSGEPGRKPAGTPDNGAAGQDGGEISLVSSATVTLLAEIAPQKGSPRGTARVLADGTDVVLGYFDRGDRIPVLRETLEDDFLTVDLDGLHAVIADDHICTENEMSYQTWEGKSKFNMPVYRDFWMLGSPVDRLNADVKLTVLYELENCYLVDADGTMGYVPKDMVTQAVTEPAPSGTPSKPSQGGNPAPAPTQPDAPAQTPDTESSGDAQQKPESGNEQPPQTEPSGGNTGSSDPEWTPPVL